MDSNGEHFGKVVEVWGLLIVFSLIKKMLSGGFFKLCVYSFINRNSDDI